MEFPEEAKPEQQRRWKERGGTADSECASRRETKTKNPEQHKVALGLETWEAV